MFTEGVPDFAVDHGMYYPAATNYGYYCTGYESPGEWENHQMVFSVDGSDVQYTGGQSENSPYICYTPSYGYPQSPYNPYNPYIPGAAIGVDSPFFGSQQYYSIPPYQNAVSSPTYVPYVIQPDISSADALIETGPAIAGRSDGRGSKYKSSSATIGFSRNASKPSMHPANSLGRCSERPRPNSGQSKQPGMHRNVSYAGFSSLASTHAFQGRTVPVSTQPIDTVSGGILLSHGQLDLAPAVSNGFSDLNSSSYPMFHKLRPKIYGGRSTNSANGSADTVSEQNRGPRTKRSRSQLIVKAYTTKAGEADPQGNIVINPDQYNKDDLIIDYTDAKFFVIKSYSEDDVHKSIKYSVWSSTHHGNKKLQSAYEDAQRIATEKSCECPIFLFFSVNASGLFCGVAEMSGPVAFHRDMDFWQQDKWSGSFPVKWHIIKDVPNSYFRHIILQNNENKPVTNSRDTQEIMLKQGLEMLKIFRDHTEKTSLLDDFLYYENRQRVMQEEKARLRNGTFLPPALDSEKDKRFVEDALKEPTVTSAGIETCINSHVKNEAKDKERGEDKEDSATSLKIGSLTIKPSETESKQAAGSSNSFCEPDSLNSIEAKSKEATCATHTLLSLDHNSGSIEPVGDIVRVGSMPIKVKGSIDSSPAVLTVGTIPLDPRSLKQ